MGNLNIDKKEWLNELFAYHFCDDCGGDAEHHTAVPFMGNWFARCDFPPNNEGERNQKIIDYRKKYHFKW